MATLSSGFLYFPIFSFFEIFSFFPWIF